MAGTISVGGLASGLDTNSIIDQLVAIERRPVTLLQTKQAEVRATHAAIDVFTAKLSNVRAAAKALQTPDDVLVRKASSSDGDVLTATAGSGALPGAVSLDVEQLARVSIAGATVGLTSADATVATSAGQLRFQVGTGDVIAIDVDETTTLTELVGAINDEQAGVTATAVNLGTASNPNYRLQLVTQATGASQTLSILQDDTTLAVSTAQTGGNARFTVSGFTGTFERETNLFSDVLSGVAISLKQEGSAQITIDDDTAAITKKAQTLAVVFNDLVTFVAGQSIVEQQDGAGSAPTVGTLAGDGTIRRILDALHQELSDVVPGATGFINLSGIGFATQKDGTVLFAESEFTAALAADADGLAGLFAGVGSDKGVADRLVDLIDLLTESGGVVASRTKGLDEEAASLQKDIDTGNRTVDTVQEQLRLQFAALESLVSSLQQQSDFVTNALKGLS